LSTPRKTKLILAAALALLLGACTEEQSKSVGQIPKKTVDKAAADINKAMQQGQDSERLKEDEK
jgi:type IV pilus biogenesis protein CpaD/CtpE